MLGFGPKPDLDCPGANLGQSISPDEREQTLMELKV